MIIGKLCFDESMREDQFYGLELCLARAGRTAHDVRAGTTMDKTVAVAAQACDVLLVTTFWYRDAYLLEGFLRQSGLKERDGRPYVLVGGMQATMTPRVFAAMADAVFIGDADDHLGGILDALEAGREPDSAYLYRAGDAIVPEPAVCAPSAFPFLKGGKRNTARIEIARGCKYKCAFCALSGLKPYQEAPWDQIKQSLDITYPVGVSVFAPDRTQHSQWDRIKRYLRRTRRQDFGQDARLDHITEVDGNSVTVGIEGLSERLRRSIGKPWSNETVTQKLGQFVETRQGAMAYANTYFIGDLPGEGDDDWAEAEDLFERIEREAWSRHLVMRPILNLLSPRPFTKLADAPVHIWRDYKTRWQRFLAGEGRGKQWGFRVLVRTAVWPAIDRLMDIIVTRGGDMAYKVIDAMPRWMLLNTTFAKGWRKNVAEKLHDEIQAFGLTDAVLGIAGDDVPWNARNGPIGMDGPATTLDETRLRR